MIVDFGLAQNKKNMIKQLEGDNKKFHLRRWVLIIIKKKKIQIYLLRFLI